MRRETDYAGHASIHTQVSKTHRLMLAMKWADEKRNRLLSDWSCIHAYTIVKLTIWCWQWSEQMRRETSYFYISIHTQFSKLTTPWCWQWSEQMHEERKQVTLVMHPYIHNLVKLTIWCWQWSEQMRRETSYFYISIHTQFSKLTTPWCWQWSEQMHEERKQVTLVMHPYIHNSINSPPSDVGNEVSRCMRRENRLLLCIHTYTI